MLPTFLERLASPDIKTVFLCGCGGGFDFVHSLTLYPWLRSLGKTLVMGSYSFGNPHRIQAAETIFQRGAVIAKRVSASAKPDERYAPEVLTCRFLDSRFPDDEPHTIYAYYARAFTISNLTELYQQLHDEHQFDAIVTFDGGSDALMRGDEEGLGDPVEDAVSVATIANLQDIPLKLLINIGLGSDRFNQVSDGATLRAIAELTAMNGFLGALSLDQAHAGLQFYRDCIEYIYQNQTFRSVIAGMILSASEGYFAGDTVPPRLEARVQAGQFFIWPLMSMLWAFDVIKVAERSMMVDWIADCTTPHDCLIAIIQQRTASRVRPVENLPRHETMRYDGRNTS